MEALPLNDWCATGGFAVVSFQTRAEYTVLNQMLASLADQKVNLIHSKPIRFTQSDNITLIDMSTHELTARSALRRRISDYDDRSSIHNPADTQGFLTQLEKLTKGVSESSWWLWWSPSDLIAHGVEEIEIAQCLRVIASDLSSLRFIALIPREVHTTRGFAIMEYLAEMHFKTGETNDGKTLWEVAKHHDTKFEGVRIEL